jgi:hypothetical protein
MSLTHSMKQSPSSDADCQLPIQYISRLLWNLKIHYRVHKSPPLDPILNQINQTQAPTSYENPANILFPFTSWSPKLSLF